MNVVSYITTAKKAYEDGDYKIAIMLLKQVPLTNEVAVKLLAKATYAAWKQGNDHYGLDKVQNTYSVIFENCAPTMLSPFDYVCLAHIYITENSLAGALKIMQLALSTGYFDSSIVLLQTWSLLTKIGTGEDCIQYMSMLAELVPAEIPDYKNGVMLLKDSDIPIYGVYLLIASFLKHNRIVSNRDPRSTQLRIEGLILESYEYYTSTKKENVKMVMKWFYSVDTWLALGLKLSKSSCPLLAEDSYWIAFLSDTKLNTAVERMIFTMKANKRTDEIFPFLSKCLKVSPFHMYCRANILLYENRNVYRDKFDKEKKYARKIQAQFRGFYTRKHLEAICAKAVVEREKHAILMGKVNKMIQKHIRKLKLSNLREWRSYTTEMKRIKISNTILIQSIFRIHKSKRILARKRLITMRANITYLHCAEYHRNVTKLRLLQYWNKYSMKHRYDRSCELIKSFIKTSIGQNALMWALSFVSKLVRIRRGYMQKRVFRYWIDKYHDTRHRKAKCTIRMWIRRILISSKLKMSEDKIKSIVNSKRMEWFLAKLERKKMKVHWKKWWELFFVIRAKRAKRFVAMRLPYIFARKKGRNKLEALRVRREIIISKTNKRVYSILSKAMKACRLLYSVRIIQRRIRIWLSCLRVKRKKYQIAMSEKLFKLSILSFMKRLWGKWTLFTQYQLEYKQRKVHKITLWYTKAKRLKNINRIIIRKYYGDKLLETLHHLFKKQAFRQLRARTTSKKMILALVNLCRNCRMFMLRKHFPTIIKFVNYQNLLRNVINNIINKRINSRIQRQCSKNSSILNNLQSKASIVLGFSTLDMHIYFKAWILSYKIKLYKTAVVASAESKILINNVVSKFLVKHYKVIKIQNMLRRYLARAVLESRRRKLRILSESSTIVETRCKFKMGRHIFRCCKIVSSFLLGKRLQIQCCWRIKLARMDVIKMKIYRAQIDSFEAMIKRKTRKKRLMTLMNLIEFGCATRSSEARMSTPREKKAQFGSKNYHFSMLHVGNSITLKKSEKDFVSEDYHRHMFRLKQSGILVLDSSCTYLQISELSFLIQNAKTIFFQSNSDHTVSLIGILTQYFQGDKVIFCGGYISNDGAREIFYFLHTLENPISLHFCEVKMPFKGVCKINRSLSLNFGKIKELFADTYSLGSLGMASLMVALRENQFVELAILKFDSSSSILPCFGSCFKSLVRNSHLREMRIVGALVNENILKGLLYAIQYGLSGMYSLEFSTCSANNSLVEELKVQGNRRVESNTGLRIKVTCNIINDSKL